jgi:hypothetical protein
MKLWPVGMHGVHGSRRLALIIYLLLVTALSVYVPCHAIREGMDGTFLYPLGYHFLWMIPPTSGGNIYIVHIDIVRIVLEIIALTAVAGIIWLLVGWERKG